MPSSPPLAMTSAGVTALAGVLLLAACGDSDFPTTPAPGDDPPAPPDPAGELVELALVADGFSSPVHLTTRPGETSPLFVVEQTGVIRVVEGGAVAQTPFLDLRDRVGTGGERGLFALAFHPDHAANGELFVHYTNTSGDTRLSRFTVTGDPDVADPASETVLLALGQPFSNHNGGQIAFGPDGFLYVALGDGGSGGDPLGNGQNTGTLLGSILRLDVDGAEPFAIPPDNPFVDDPDARDEIWAHGLRNPWRFSFDRQNGDLWIGDVGQDRREEINRQPAASPGGENYGWNVMEGEECFESSGCDTAGLTLPVHTYANAPGGGCSVTGGFVYRGSALPALQGRYLFADFCAGFVRALTVAGGSVTDVETLLTEVGSISSFGEDGAGELYVLDLGGRVYRVVAGGG
ncbi:MAG: PQQ-dependent sugar dehydrogenase [Longimicrobiales bacterium]|nr:PQQ-dependent sugar dehydrogenase [Longimicrobiales bacterium]